MSAHVREYKVNLFSFIPNYPLGILFPKNIGVLSCQFRRVIQSYCVILRHTEYTYGPAKILSLEHSQAQCFGCSLVHRP